MGTWVDLSKRLKNELSVEEYNRSGKWFQEHIDRLTAWYPFVEVGAVIKVDIDGEIITRVKAFHFVSDGGILVETEYGNVYYYETKRASIEEIEKYLVESN